MNKLTRVWLLALLTTLPTPASLAATVPPTATADTKTSPTPTTPTGLTARAGDAQVTLSWNTSAGATSYTVYRRSASSNEAILVATGVAARSFVDTGLTNGTTYSYWVRASNAGATSDLSNGASASPQVPAPIDAPVILRSAAGDAQVAFEWTAVPDASGYRVFRNTAGVWETTPLAQVTDTQYRNDGLTNGAMYSYRVVAFNSGGAGPFSSVVAGMPVSASTGATAVAGDTPTATTAPIVSGFSSIPPSSKAPLPQQQPAPSLAPLAPANVTPAAGEAVSPTPQPPASPASSVPSNPMPTAGEPLPATPQPLPSSAPANVSATVIANAPVLMNTPRTEDPASAARVAETPITNIEPSNGTASSGEASQESADTGLTNTGTPTPPPPAAPQGVSATAGNGFITLTWTPVSGATGYNLYRSITPNQEVRVSVLGPLVSPYVDTPIENGVTYYYKLTAVSATGESAKSSEVNSTPIAPPAPPDPATVAAFRFLRQATWGPKPGDVEIVKSMGVDAFLDQQFSAPASTYPDTLFTMPTDMAQERFMELALTGPDQLRQRVAWALHKIWVVSAVEVTTAPAIVTYHRLFLNGAFGNFRDLMTDVTLNPAMGRYLNMLNNRSQAVTGSLPNENYARELMQLFTLGIPRLEGNGAPSAMLSTPGVPVIAYTEQDVKELARILTGWTFGDGNPATVPTNLGKENYKVPMEAVARFHDAGAKLFLDTYVPAGQSTRQDLDQALDVLFRRSNLGPFISRQLIQQLVTSNPSPAYVADISAVFNGNGGARGDLAAVVRAILTHPEAGVSTATSGKLTEPALFVISQLRALNASVTDHPFMANKAESMGQKVLYPASVFSYFSPGYRVRGTIGPGGLPLGGPEFQILTTVTALERANFVGGLLGGYFGADVVIDYTPFTSLAANAQALVDYCSLLFMGGRMSPEARLEIINAVLATRADKPSERVRTALYLTLTAAQFQVDR